MENTGITGTCAISNIYALLECGKKVVISSFLISRAKYMLLLYPKHAVA